MAQAKVRRSSRFIGCVSGSIRPLDVPGSGTINSGGPGSSNVSALGIPADAVRGLQFPRNRKHRLLEIGPLVCWYWLPTMSAEPPAVVQLLDEVIFRCEVCGWWIDRDEESKKEGVCDEC